MLSPIGTRRKTSRLMSSATSVVCLRRAAAANSDRSGLVAPVSTNFHRWTYQARGGAQIPRARSRLQMSDARDGRVIGGPPMILRSVRIWRHQIVIQRTVVAFNARNKSSRRAPAGSRRWRRRSEVGENQNGARSERQDQSAVVDDRFINRRICRRPVAWPTKASHFPDNYVVAGECPSRLGALQATLATTPKL
jgi:hypothetical protein